jgi:hypothetical protein
MAKLKKDGWTVLRTAGSHGPFDLIAIKDSVYLFNNEAGAIGGEGEMRLIQVKSGKSAKREMRKALGDIERFTGLYNVVVQVV